MSFSSSFAGALRGLCLAAIIAFSAAAAAQPAHAQSPVAARTLSAPPPFAGLTDYIVGNRTRMIQVTCIGFGLGILILVTATRKH